jgi:Domain of unknown function (DUF4252)
MKKYLFLFVVSVLATQNLQAQSVSFDRFVRKVKKANRESERHDITIPGFLIRFASNFVNEDDLEGIDIKIITKKLSELRIVTIEDNKGIATEDYKKFIEDVHNEGFEDLMVVRSDDTKVRFMIKERKDFIRNIVLLVDEKSGGDFVMLSLEGKFTMEDVNKLVKNVEIDGIGKKHKTNSVKTVRD